MTEKSINDIMNNYQKALSEKRLCTTCDDTITSFKDMEGILEFGKTGQCKRCQMVGGDFPPKNRSNPVITEQEHIEMNEEAIVEKLADRPKRNTCGFLTDSASNYIEDGDKLEANVIIYINVKHPRYKQFITELKGLLYNGRKESGLVTYMSGV